MICVQTTDTKAVLSLLVAAALVFTLALTCATEAYAGDDSPTLRVLLSFPPHVSDRDETEEERVVRLTEIAEAIDASTKTREERALLLAVGHHESHFASAVCSGAKLGDKGRAYGCFQSWEKDRSGGIPGQVERAITHLRRGAGFCGARGFERLHGAISLYARGLCHWRGADKRVATVRTLESKL